MFNPHAREQVPLARRFIPQVKAEKGNQKWEMQHQHHSSLSFACLGENAKIGVVLNTPIPQIGEK